MKQVLCARCKKRPAMFFVTKVEGDKTTQEGLCIKCALEMNIGPVKQIMQSMGISWTMSASSSRQCSARTEALSRAERAQCRSSRISPQ